MGILWVSCHNSEQVFPGQWLAAHTHRNTHIYRCGFVARFNRATHRCYPAFLQNRMISELLINKLLLLSLNFHFFTQVGCISDATNPRRGWDGLVQSLFPTFPVNKSISQSPKRSKFFYKEPQRCNRGVKNYKVKQKDQKERRRDADK